MGNEDNNTLVSPPYVEVTKVFTLYSSVYITGYQSTATVRLFGLASRYQSVAVDVTGPVQAGRPAALPNVGVMVSSLSWLQGNAEKFLFFAFFLNIFFLNRLFLQALYQGPSSSCCFDVSESYHHARGRRIWGRKDFFRRWGGGLICRTCELIFHSLH